MSRIPHERYDHDVAGMPVFAATAPIQIVVGPKAMKSAVPKDDEHCAIAEACRLQLESPYVSVGRSRTDVAEPHPKGVEKSGYPGKWAIIRYANTPTAKELIIAADTGKLTEAGAVVMLNRPKPSLLPGPRRERNKVSRKPKGTDDGRGRGSQDARKDALTVMGVRILTGQRSRGD